MQQKNSFAVSNPPKCIANLGTQPIHFKMNLEIYQTLFVMKEVVKFKLHLNFIPAKNMTDVLKRFGAYSILNVLIGRQSDSKHLR